MKLLVLGRPGSGCTSLLRILSNDRDSYDEITGKTRYGSMDHKAAEQFRQQIMFNNEGSLIHVRYISRFSQYNLQMTFISPHLPSIGP